MPNPSQIRKQRIQKLSDKFTNSKIQNIDPIFEKAIFMFPTVRKKTVKTYAQAVLREHKK